MLARPGRAGRQRWGSRRGSGRVDRLARALAFGLLAFAFLGLALLPGGATLTGMVPDALAQSARSRLLDPAIMVPPLLWLVSHAALTTSGCRVTANRWEDGNPMAAVEDAGWVRASRDRPAP